MAKILIVDDEVGVRDLLSEILGSQHHHVMSASMHCEATELLFSFAPEIVLLDYWLAEGNSYDVLRNWRAIDGMKTEFVVMAHAAQDCEAQMRSAGAAAFLEKPISHYRLIEALRPLLDKDLSAPAVVDRRKSQTPSHPLRRVVDLLPASETGISFNRRAGDRAPTSRQQAAEQELIDGAIAQAMINADCAELSPLFAALPALFKQDLKEARLEFERLYLMRLLIECAGSITLVSKKSNMERTHLYRRLKQLGLEHHLLAARQQQGNIIKRAKRSTPSAAVAGAD